MTLSRPVRLNILLVEWLAYYFLILKSMHFIIASLKHVCAQDLKKKKKFPHLAWPIYSKEIFFLIVRNNHLRIYVSGPWPDFYSILLKRLFTPCFFFPFNDLGLFLFSWMQHAKRGRMLQHWPCSDWISFTVVVFTTMLLMCALMAFHRYSSRVQRLPYIAEGSGWENVI